MNLTGLRVVVTGASSGIGAATAAAFAAAGARVTAAARDQAGLERVALRARELGGRAATRAVDVTDAAAVAALAAEVAGEFGGIDLWFSCAGVGTLGRYQDVPMADHARIVATNLVGHMNEAHAVLPIFRAQERGTWVNMISVGGLIATPYAAAYAASKFGLVGFSRALRGELSKWPDIHVCDVYPTFVDTPGVDHAGNYTGARLTLPPGALAPDTVARAVVRLATRPRDTTVVGAPAAALKLGDLLVPNLLPAVMSGFLDVWSARAPAGADTAGTIHAPAGLPAGADGGRRDPELRRKAAVAGVGLAAAGAALGVGLLLRRRR